MSKKLNNKKEYKIDSEKLHSFLVCCDRIDVEFYEIMQYSTQLLILADAYYDEQYDRVLICECICSSIRYLFDIVAKEYDMISEYRNLHDDIAGIA